MALRLRPAQKAVHTMMLGGEVFALVTVGEEVVHGAAGRTGAPVGDGEDSHGAGGRVDLREDPGEVVHGSGGRTGTLGSAKVT